MEAEDGSEKRRAKEERRAKVWKGGGEARRERNAPEKEGHAQERSRRKRWKGKEPQTGDCDRALRGSEERRESPEEEGREEEQSQKGRPEALALSDPERCKQIAAVDHPMIDRRFFLAHQFRFCGLFPKIDAT